MKSLLKTMGKFVPPRNHNKLNIIRKVTIGAFCKCNSYCNRVTESKYGQLDEILVDFTITCHQLFSNNVTMVATLEIILISLDLILGCRKSNKILKS